MTFTFRGTVKSPTGTVQTGTARVTALAPVKDTSGDVVFTGTSPQALVTGPPSFSFSLPDSSIASAYQLDVVDSNGAAVPFLSPVVFAAGAASTTLDLSDVVGTSPVVAVPTTYTAVINYSGTGFPEGVVTAPVGSRYVDTAATSGAVEWVKASGSGNTGWKVTHGDTGTRVVSSLLPANMTPGSGGVRLQRINASVFCFGSVATNDASVIAGQTLLTLPSGFQAPFNASGAGIPLGYGVNDAALNNPVGHIARLTGTYGLIFQRAGTLDSTSVRWYATWPTNDAWPSTLPGT